MKYFVSVCKSQNFTKSAQELFVSQPTLSVAMKELEKEVGTALFHKKGTHIFLTEAGSALHQEVSAVLRQYEQMQELIQSGDLERNYVRLGFSSIVGSSAAPNICRQFLSDNPHLRIKISEDYKNNLLQQLENDQLDVVLTGRSGTDRIRGSEKFQTFDLEDRDAYLTYCVGPSSPIAQQKEISLEEIASAPLIMLDKTFPIAQRLESSFETRGYALNVILRTPQMFTVERFVAAGVAGGFLPRQLCDSSEVVYLRCAELEALQEIPVSLYWKKENLTSAPLLKFLESARRAYPPRL